MDIGVSGGIFFEAGVACISAVQGCAPQGHSERGRNELGLGVAGQGWILHKNKESGHARGR